MNSVPVQIKNGQLIINPTSKARFCEKDGWADLERRVPERSLSQLKRYRAWLTITAEATGNDTEALHEFLLDKLAPRVVTKICGKKGCIEKTQKKRTSGGHALSMSKPEMVEYCDKAATLTGYRFPTDKELEAMGYVLNK